MPAFYVPVWSKKKHAREAVWFTTATVHWSNFCIFVDSIDSHSLRMIHVRVRNEKALGSDTENLDPVND